MKPGQYTPALLRPDNKDGPRPFTPPGFDSKPPRGPPSPRSKFSVSPLRSRHNHSDQKDAVGRRAFGSGLRSETVALYSLPSASTSANGNVSDYVTLLLLIHWLEGVPGAS